MGMGYDREDQTYTEEQKTVYRRLVGAVYTSLEGVSGTTRGCSQEWEADLLKQEWLESNALHKAKMFCEELHQKLDEIDIDAAVIAAKHVMKQRHDYNEEVSNLGVVKEGFNEWTRKRLVPEYNKVLKERKEMAAAAAVVQ